MKIERIILIFQKSGDKLLHKINADNVDISICEKLFSPIEDDPNFYRPYKINQPQFDELIKYIEELKLYPCSDFESYLEVVTV